MKVYSIENDIAAAKVHIETLNKYLLANIQFNNYNGVSVADDDLFIHFDDVMDETALDDAVHNHTFDEAAVLREYIKSDVFEKIKLGVFDKASATCQYNGLTITTSIEHILDDVYTVSPSPTSEKCILIKYIYDFSSDSLDLSIHEKTVGYYGGIPESAILISNLKEFKVPANGSELTEVRSWL